MPTRKIVSSVIDGFSDYVQKGMFSGAFVGADPEYYSGGRCHSRVLGLLVQSIQKLGYYVDVERSVYFHKPIIKDGRKMTKFRPDITVLDESERIVGIVEYETIDATAEHLRKKVNYFKRALPENPDIKFILFLPTLTTLSKRPSAWIEKNRSIYIEPLTKSLSNLSSSFPHVEFCFAFLKEDGITARIIVKGTIKKEFKKNIFE